MTRFKILILFLFLANYSFSQYYQNFSQYLLNQEAINPAYTGSREVLSATMLYRDQWIGFKGAPKTMTFAAHTPLTHLSSALGLQIYSDNIGVSKHKGIFINYAYRVRFKKNNRILSIGTGCGVNSFTSDFSSLNINNTADKAFEYQYLRAIRPNFSFGLYYTSKHIFAGASIPTLLRYGYDVFGKTADSLRTNPQNTYYVFGYVFGVDKDICFSPSVLLKTATPQKGQFDVNLKLSIYNTLSMALSVRVGESLVWIIEYQLIQNQLKIAYSHDFSTTMLNRYAHGTNEFMLRYEFAYKSNMNSTKLFK